MNENLGPYHCCNNFEELKNKMDLHLAHLHIFFVNRNILISPPPPSPSGDKTHVPVSTIIGLFCAFDLSYFSLVFVCLSGCLSVYFSIYHLNVSVYNNVLGTQPSEMTLNKYFRLNGLFDILDSASQIVQ